MPNYFLYDPNEEKSKKQPAPNPSNKQEQQEYQNECTVIFTRLNKQNKKSVNLVSSTEKEKHRWVYGGINLAGVCQNSDCPGKVEAWYNLGYGTFQINKVVLQGKCRKCGSKIPRKSVLSMGFTKAIVQLQGVMIEGDKQIQFNQTYEQRNGKFQLFKNNDANLAEWQYLTIVCKQI